MRHIKAALRKAAKWGLIEKAPEIEMLKTPKRLPRHIPPEQLEEILNAEQHPKRKRLWLFLLWTGCRRSEALNLSWEHITWSEKPAARIVGKGDKERIVPLLPPAAKALGKRADLGPVFPGFHPITTSKWWRGLVKKAGYPGVRLHDLRHTCFTYRVSKGVNLKVVQTIAGHSDIRVTMGYAQGLVGDLYDEMAEVFK